MCECPGEADTSRGLTYTNGGDLVQMEQWYKSAVEPTAATIEIPLTRGYVTRIDAADKVLTDGHHWQAAVDPNRRAVYAVGVVDGKTVYMHQLLCPDWGEVDHVDGDGLNNQRINLRDGTGPGNQANKGMQRNNTSGFKGVSWNKHQRKWVAGIKINRKRIHLGTYSTPEEAADAYDQAAVRLFGEYARTNAMMGQVAGASPPPAWHHHPPADERTHCAAGHEYTPENTFIRRSGSRECRKCRKRWRAESRERVRQRKRAA